MFTKDQVQGGAARRGRRGLSFGWWLAPVGMIVIWLAGCETSAPTAPTKPAASEAKPAQAATPAASAQTPQAAPATVPVAPSNVTGKVPKIRAEKDTIDLGRIGMGTRHKGQFQFTNAGDGVLKVLLVQSCCGVTLKGVEVGQQYAPGQGGTLQFEYRAPDVPNVGLERKLYLETNDPNQKVTILTIKADIVRRVACRPEVLKLVLNQPNGGCADITLTSLNDEPFSVTGFQATGDAITATVNPDEKGTDIVLRPKVDLAKLEQNMRGQISINLTHPDCNNVRLMYDTLPEFEITPPRLTMFGLKTGEATQRDIWILSNYQSDFEIASVSSPKGIIKLLEKTKVQNRYQLHIEVMPPPHKPEETLTTDVLEVKIKDGRTLSIPFQGFYE